MKMILKVTKEYEKIDIIRNLLYELNDLDLDLTFNNRIPNKYALSLNGVKTTLTTATFTTYSDVISALQILIASKKEVKNDKSDN